MKTINGVAGLLALGCAMGAFAEGEKQTYKISDTVDGIDLLAQAETYMTDRLEGPAPKKEVRDGKLELGASGFVILVK